MEIVAHHAAKRPKRHVELHKLGVCLVTDVETDMPPLGAQTSPTSVLLGDGRDAERKRSVMSPLKMPAPAEKVDPWKTWYVSSSKAWWSDA